MCKSGSSKASKQQAEEARRQEEERQQRIAQGASIIDQAFAGYDDDFFSDRYKSYVDFATPQREDNIEQGARLVAAALARQGITESSVASEKKEELAEANAAMGREIASNALRYENMARANINEAKQRLLEQNAALADPGVANRLSATAAANAAALPTFDNITNAAANIAQGLASQADLERRGMSRFNVFGYEPYTLGSSRMVS